MHFIPSYAFRAYSARLRSRHVDAPPHKSLVVLAVGGPNSQRLYRRTLQAALPGVAGDKARGMSASPDQWRKRLCAGVDEAQRAIIHVRRTGAANWRYALLFRDWLRANDSRRDEYAATKLRIAEMHADDPHFDGYARSKDFWFDHAYEIAEEWAREVHWTAPVHRRAED